MTQAQKIMDLLIDRDSFGAYVFELCGPRPDGLGCSQYNARILELRRKGHRIVNDRPGHFVLHREPAQTSIYEKSAQV